jgi:hypothetical protein
MLQTVPPSVGTSENAADCTAKCLEWIEVAMGLLRQTHSFDGMLLHATKSQMTSEKRNLIFDHSQHEYWNFSFGYLVSICGLLDSSIIKSLINR